MLRSCCGWIANLLLLKSRDTTVFQTVNRLDFGCFHGEFRYMARYVFITGGVVSSLGKGLASAALGALLQARGFSVRLRKLDPYLNVDPGTMSPFEHGEVFVTDDGAETDLDLGHYERFTGVAARIPIPYLQGGFIPPCWKRNAVAIIWAKPFRSSPMLQMKSKTSSIPAMMKSISCSAKSAALWAISRACRSLRQSASLPMTNQPGSAFSCI